MATVQTAYSPEESCREVGDHIGKAYRILTSSRNLDLFGKIDKDKEFVEALDLTATIFRKLEYSIINRLYTHLTALDRYAQSLLKKGNVPIATIEKIKEEMGKLKAVFEEIKKEEYRDMRKANYLRGEAAHLERKTKAGLRGVTRRLHKASRQLKAQADKQVEKAKKAEEEAEEKRKEALKLSKEAKK